MVEKNPWYKNVEGPFREWSGPVGVKSDGGGCTRAQGKVGEMKIHHAVSNRDEKRIIELVDAGHSVNEVEAAGSTPLHFAAWNGWIEGAQLLISLGAHINATNNAGDAPLHWARNMGLDDMVKFLKDNGASEESGDVLVQDHIPKVKDFFQKECWKNHPKPHMDFMDSQLAEDDRMAAESKKLLPGM